MNVKLSQSVRYNFTVKLLNRQKGKIGTIYFMLSLPPNKTSLIFSMYLCDYFKMVCIDFKELGQGSSLQSEKENKRLFMLKKCTVRGGVKLNTLT